MRSRRRRAKSARSPEGNLVNSRVAPLSTRKQSMIPSSEDASCSAVAPLWVDQEAGGGKTSRYGLSTLLWSPNQTTWRCAWSGTEDWTYYSVLAKQAAWASGWLPHGACETMKRNLWWVNRVAETTRRWPEPGEKEAASDTATESEKSNATPRARVVPVVEDPQKTSPRPQSEAHAVSVSVSAKVSASATTSKRERSWRNKVFRNWESLILRTFWKTQESSRCRGVLSGGMTRRRAGWATGPGFGSTSPHAHSKWNAG